MKYEYVSELKGDLVENSLKPTQRALGFAELLF
jgi:hypothetical protein